MSTSKFINRRALQLVCLTLALVVFLSACESERARKKRQAEEMRQQDIERLVRMWEENKEEETNEKQQQSSSE